MELFLNSNQELGVLRRTWKFMIYSSFWTWSTFYTTSVICTSAAIQKDNQSPDKFWCCRVRIPDCRMKKENWATLPFLVFCHSRKKHFMVFLVFLCITSILIGYCSAEPIHWKCFAKIWERQLITFRAIIKKTFCGCVTFARVTIHQTKEISLLNH